MLTSNLFRSTKRFLTTIRIRHFCQNIHGLLNISINCLDKMLHCLNYNVACCIDFWNFNFSILCATTLEKLTQELQNLLRNSTHELTHKI